MFELFRNGERDRLKAREHLALNARAEFRKLMKDYDAYVAHMNEVTEPAIHLGSAFDSVGDEIPVRIPMEDFFAMGLTSGASGAGKTVFMTGIAAEMLANGYGVGVIDCKQDLYFGALNILGAMAYRMSENRRKDFIRRIAVINPFGKTIAPLNVCRLLPGMTPEVQAYDVSVALGKLFDTNLGFQMENILRHLVLLLMESELTLAEAPWVLRDEALRQLLAEHARIPAVREFFLRTYRSVPDASKDALLTRLQALLLPENLRLMLGADDLVDFKGIFDRGDPMVVFLGKGPGVPEELVEIIGSLLLQLCFQGAFASGQGRRRPYELMLDEFFHLLNAPTLLKRFETGLTTLRSFGVFLNLIMHNFSQVPGSLRETILGNCDIMALFKTSSRNAQFFGDFLPECDPELTEESLRNSRRMPGKYEVKAKLLEELQRLPTKTCYWYDRRKPYRAVPLKIRNMLPPHEAIGIPKAELERFMEDHGIAQGGAALSREELKQQVARRERKLLELMQSTAPSGPDVSSHKRK